MSTTAGATAAQPLISCTADGGVETSASLNVLRTATALRVRLHNEHHLPHEQLLRLGNRSLTGMTSRRFFGEHLVLKVGVDTALIRREACVLSILRGSAVVPRLLCANAHLVLLEKAGEPVTASNIPADYREQAESILATLRDAGVRHNDIWKDDIYTADLFATELLVDVAGKMRLVDFNTASAPRPPGNVTMCDADVSSPPMIGGQRYEGTYDPHVLRVLDALYLVNRTLQSYQRAGLAVRHGICQQQSRSRAASLYLRGEAVRETATDAAREAARQAEAQLVEAMKARTASEEDALCREARDGMNGEFRSIFGQIPRLAKMGQHNSSEEDKRAPTGAGAQHQATHALFRLPSALNPMPFLSDLQACVARCRACGSRCRAVSVSSQRSTCTWYAPHEPTVCKPLWGAATLRTAMPRPLWMGPPTNHTPSWEMHQRLDDFVTVELYTV